MNVVDLLVAKWHTSDDSQKLSLSEYLGMSQEEYVAWVKNPDELPPLLARINGLFAYPEEELQLIVDERQYQLIHDKRSPEKDDRYTTGQLAAAARTYLTLHTWRSANANLELSTQTALQYWPWRPETFKPSADPIRNLTKAISLAFAELSRVIRERVKKGDKKPILFARYDPRVVNLQDLSSSDRELAKEQSWPTNDPYAVYGRTSDIQIESIFVAADEERKNNLAALEAGLKTGTLELTKVPTLTEDDVPSYMEDDGLFPKQENKVTLNFMAVKGAKKVTVYSAMPLPANLVVTIHNKPATVISRDTNQLTVSLEPASPETALDYAATQAALADLPVEQGAKMLQAGHAPARSRSEGMEAVRAAIDHAKRGDVMVFAVSFFLGISMDEVREMSTEAFQQAVKDLEQSGNVPHPNEQVKSYAAGDPRFNAPALPLGTLPIADPAKFLETANDALRLGANVVGAIREKLAPTQTLVPADMDNRWLQRLGEKVVPLVADKADAPDLPEIVQDIAKDLLRVGVAANRLYQERQRITDARALLAEMYAYCRDRGVTGRRWEDEVGDVLVQVAPKDLPSIYSPNQYPGPATGQNS